MKFIELMANKAKDLFNEKIPTMVFFGDSVTQGCFDVYIDEENKCNTNFDPNKSYQSYLNDILKGIFPNVPLASINAGISGDGTEGGLKRIDRDVLCYNPDLVIVGFGLNDSVCLEEGIEKYRNNLSDIFKKIKQKGCENIIFLTPNMMNTRESCRLKDKQLKEIAEMTMNIQNDGILDKYAEAGIEVAKENGVAICDVYSRWKKLEKSGRDITTLLSNSINHPTAEMNKFVANLIFDILIEN